MIMISKSLFTVVSTALTVTVTMSTSSTTRHVHAFTTSPAGVKMRTTRIASSSSSSSSSLPSLPLPFLIGSGAGAGSKVAPFHLSPATTSSLLLPPYSLQSASSSALSMSMISNENNQDPNSEMIVEADVIDKIQKIRTTDANTDVIQGVHPFLLQPWNKVQNWFQQQQQNRTMLKQKQIRMRMPQSLSFLSRQKVTSLIVAAFITLSVLLTPLSDALAAPSGGRMGGSFGGSSSSSRSGMSRSYSSPRSRSSPSGSRGSGSTMRQRYSPGGGYSRPTIIAAPSYYSPAPYNYGYGYGYGSGSGGVTVIRRGPSVVDVFVYGVLAVVLYSAVTSFGNDTDVDNDNDTYDNVNSVLGPGVSVAQISVALHVPNKDDPSSVVSFLNRLSSTARTDSRVGVSNLVSQVAIELLRKKRSAFAASSKYTHYRNSNKANKDFSSLAIQERSKFEREDVSNYGGVEYGIGKTTLSGSDSSITGSDSFSPKATAAVVTIILSIDGDSTKVPIINSVNDLERALTQIASDVKVDGCLRSAEVLWTPQSEGDTLTERDVIVDYPELRSV